ncbi:hypothetical protein L1887_53018 [Cichorium endivia]|nr:hypothetical protein L1887_53018 [Cichorium endivia]
MVRQGRRRPRASRSTTPTSCRRCIDCSATSREALSPPRARSATRPRRSDERARSSRMRLDDMSYDIIELKAEASSSARRLEQSMVIDSLRRKITRLSADGGYESANRFSNILARLSDPAAPNQLRNLRGMLELMDALAFTSSDAGASATPASRAASRAVSSNRNWRESELKATPYTIADTPATSAPATERADAMHRRAQPAPVDSRLTSTESRPTAAKIRGEVAPIGSDTRSANSSSQTTKNQLITMSDLTRDSGHPLSKAQLVSNLRQHMGRKQIPENELLHDVIFLMQGINGRHVRFQEEFQYDAAANSGGAEAAGPTKVVRVVFNEGDAGEEHNASLGPHHAEPVPLHLERAHGVLSAGGQPRSANGTQRRTAVLAARLGSQQSGGKGLDGDGQNTPTTYVTLKRLSLWTEEMTLRFRLMSTIIESCQDAHGGSLVSLIHSYTFNGDPFIRRFTSSLLDEVSKPFFHSLSLWIYEGELQDPFREFFVELNDDPRAAGQRRSNAEQVSVSQRDAAELLAGVVRAQDLLDGQESQLYPPELRRRRLGGDEAYGLGRSCGAAVYGPARAGEHDRKGLHVGEQTIAGHLPGPIPAAGTPARSQGLPHAGAGRLCGSVDVVARPEPEPACQLAVPSQSDRVARDGDPRVERAHGRHGVGDVYARVQAGLAGEYGAGQPGDGGVPDDLYASVEDQAGGAGAQHELAALARDGNDAVSDQARYGWRGGVGSAARVAADDADAFGDGALYPTDARVRAARGDRILVERPAALFLAAAGRSGRADLEPPCVSECADRQGAAARRQARIARTIWRASCARSLTAF